MGGCVEEQKGGFVTTSGRPERDPAIRWCGTFGGLAVRTGRAEVSESHQGGGCRGGVLRGD